MDLTAFLTSFLGLDVMKEQKKFLNIPAEDNPLLFAIFMIMKFAIAGWGTVHLLNRSTTMVFIFGTFINACINFKCWFKILRSVSFGAGTFGILSYSPRNLKFSVILWTFICLWEEWRFYIDIYVLVCFIAYIFQLYDKEYIKAAMCILAMTFFNWMIESEEIFLVGNVYILFPIYFCLLLILTPSIDDLDTPNNRRICYFCVNAVIYLLLGYKYCRIALKKDYFQNILAYFLIVFNDKYILNKYYHLLNLAVYFKPVMNNLTDFDPAATSEKGVSNDTFVSPLLPFVEAM